MAKKAYIGVDNVVRRIRKCYVGVDGVARRIKKVYIGGPDGTARVCWNGGDLKYFTQAQSLSIPRMNLAAASAGGYALFGGGSIADAPLEVATAEAYSYSLTRVLPDSLRSARESLVAGSVGDYAIFGGGYKPNYASFTSSGDVYNSSLVHSSLSLNSFVEQAVATVGDYVIFFGGDQPTTGKDTGQAIAVSSSLTIHTIYDQRAPYSYSRYRGAGASTKSHAIFAGGTEWRSGAGASDSNLADSINESLTRSYITSLKHRRTYLSGASVNGYVLFAGGCSNFDANGQTYVECYDDSLVLTEIGELAEGRHSCSGSSIEGYAVFAGGLSQPQNSSLPGGNDSFYRSSVEAYNEQLVRVSCDPLSHSITGFAAVTLDDMILFGGGYYHNRYSDPTEDFIYDTVDVFMLR